MPVTEMNLVHAGFTHQRGPFERALSSPDVTKAAPGSPGTWTNKTIVDTKYAVLVGGLLAAFLPKGRRVCCCCGQEKNEHRREVLLGRYTVWKCREDALAKAGWPRRGAHAVTKYASTTARRPPLRQRLPPPQACPA
jgi:hypothetical protein